VSWRDGYTAERLSSAAREEPFTVNVKRCLLAGKAAFPAPLESCGSTTPMHSTAALSLEGGRAPSGTVCPGPPEEHAWACVYSAAKERSRVGTGTVTRIDSERAIAGMDRLAGLEAGAT
jgi:hypothetical protein